MGGVNLAESGKRKAESGKPAVGAIPFGSGTPGDKQVPYGATVA